MAEKCLASRGRFTLTYTFDVTFDAGQLNGQTFMGLFALDGFVGSGFEFFAPLGSSEPAVTGTLLALMIEINGDMFTMEDDVEFPDLPVVEAQDGDISFIDFVTDNTVVPSLDIQGTPVELLSVTYVDGFGNSSSGYWSNAQVVPIPAAVWLFGSGLIGLVGISRRKKAL